MNTQRIQQVKSIMEKENLDAIVCRLPENVLFLSGHWPLLGWSFLVFPLEGLPVCIIPHCDEKEALEELWDADCISFLFAVLDAGNPYEEIAKHLKTVCGKKNWKHIGYEGNFENIAPPWNTAEPAIPADTTRSLLYEVFGEDTLIDVTSVLNSMRACKTLYEIEKIRTVNEIATFGLKTFFENVEPGVSGYELAAEIEYSVVIQGTGYKGSKRVRGFAQVSTGAEETAVGYRPMLISTSRKLESGDLAIVELAVVADGFWSDRTRVRVAGKPSEKQSAVFETVKSTHQAALEKVKAGIAAGEVDEAARAIIRDAGYEEEFLHVTGHGLGFRYHEPVPLICPGSDFVLEAGMIHSVEPGIYLPEIGGIRLEENVVVTEDGCEVLGPFNKEFHG